MSRWRPLGALEEDLLSLVDLLLQDQGAVGDVRPEPLGIGPVLLEDRLAVDRLLPEELREVEVLLLHIPVQLFPEDLFVEEVADADADPGDLVLIGRPDAPAGRADLLADAVRFPGDVDPPVVGHDDVGLFADEEPRVGGKQAAVLGGCPSPRSGPAGSTTTPLPMMQILPVMEDAGRDEMQDGLLPLDDQGVAGVVAPLEPGDDIGVFRIEIDNFSLSFITPLGSNHDHVCHRRSLPTSYRRCEVFTSPDR